MQKTKWQIAIIFAFIILLSGLVNITSFKAPSVYLNGQKVDVLVDNKWRVKNSNLQEVWGEVGVLEKKPTLSELCKNKGYSFTYDKNTNIVSISDEKKYVSEVSVLLYHHLLPRWQIDDYWGNNDILVSCEDFLAQMEYLKENGYKTVSPQQLEDFILGKSLLEDKSVVITFDDGFLSTYKYAYPILKQNDFKAMLFVVTGQMNDEKSDFNYKLLQYLSWDELWQMGDVFTFASHSDNLHFLKNNKSGVVAQTDDRMNDLKLSRSKLGQSVYFSYPYGNYSDESKELVKNCGFKMAFIVNGSKVKVNDDMFALSRYDMANVKNLSEFKDILQ